MPRVWRAQHTYRFFKRHIVSFFSFGAVPCLVHPRDDIDGNNPSADLICLFFAAFCPFQSLGDGILEAEKMFEGEPEKSLVAAILWAFDVS